MQVSIQNFSAINRCQITPLLKFIYKFRFILTKLVIIGLFSDETEITSLGEAHLFFFLGYYLPLYDIFFNSSLRSVFITYITFGDIRV